MTVQEWQAGQIEHSAKFLAHSVATTRTDKLDWKPAADDSSKTRSALEQIEECVGLNRRFAAVISGRTPPEKSDARPFLDGNSAQSELIASAAELAAAVRGLSDDALIQAHETPFGPLTSAQLISIATGNMHYHFGQVSFIQTLYGDTEFHFPPDVM